MECHGINPAKPKPKRGLIERMSDNTQTIGQSDKTSKQEKRRSIMAYSKRQISLSFDSCRPRRQSKKAKVGRERSAAESRAHNTGRNKPRRIPGKTEGRLYA